MKKLFAVFCAICLMPTFSAQAWIGGPFSNNSFFGENGDDGVYEAVAFPTRGFANGIGIFRWGVGNQTAFTSDSTISVSRVVFDDEGNIASTFVDIRPVASNIYFGGTGQISHSWYLEGVVYRGNCDGVVNSGLGFISCVGNATNPNVSSERIASGFKASFDNEGEGLPISRFSGRGNGRTSNFFDPASDTTFAFTVFGSKVNPFITVNGTR